MVFNKGEYVVYKKKGVYIIKDIRREKIASEYRNYYVLNSVYDNNSTIYVPADCEALVSRMEGVLSPMEIEEIIERSKMIDIEWKSDYLQRQSDFEEILNSDNLSAVIALYRMLKNRKDEALLTKTKVSAVDERALANAKRVLSEAFAFSLGIDKKSVTDYIFEKIT